MIIDLKKISKYRLIGAGTEGKIYELSNEYCMKIFNKELAVEKEEKIRLMIGVSAMKSRKDITWPLEMITDSQGRFIGYVMKKIPGGSHTLNDFFIRKLYQLDNSVIISTGIDLLKCVKVIHDNSFIIADFNPKNWIITLKGEIIAVDVDNYQFCTKEGKCFKANVACSEYLDKSLQMLLSKYGTPNRFPEGSFNLMTDAFGIGVLLFELLMNGTHPYHGLGNRDFQMCIEYNICHDYAPYFAKGNPEDIKKGYPPINVLSKELQKMFFEMFFGERNINNLEERIIAELESYEKQLTKKCQYNRVTHHFLPIWSECPWCEIHRVKENINLQDKAKNIQTTSHPKMNKSTNQLKSRGTTNSVAALNNCSQVQYFNGGNSKVNNTTSQSMKKYNPKTQSKKIKKDQNRYKWVMTIFFVVVAIEIGFFAKGYIGNYFELTIGRDDTIFLHVLAPYLMLVAGIAVALFVSYLIYSFEFSNGPTVVLDLAAQAGAFYILLGVVGAFVTIASYLLIVVILVSLIGAFLSGL